MISSTSLCRKVQKIGFSKYAGCGNDFILIDNRTQIFPSPHHQFVKNICKRQQGVGADGVILLEHSQVAHYRMRIFNSDGSEAEMCGNGIRCLGKFIKECDISGTQFNIEVMGKIYPIEVEHEMIGVQMNPPTNIQLSIKINVDGNTLNLDYLDTGVPHVVIFTEDLNDPKLMQLAPKIRHHPLFAPKGANVNFASLTAQGGVTVRTYERGVEGETLACGTGATAVAIIAQKKYGLKNPITIHTKSKETLDLNITFDNTGVYNIYMRGPAHFIYRGILDNQEQY